MSLGQKETIEDLDKYRQTSGSICRAISQYPKRRLKSKTKE